jgi:hypothetical protein
MSGDDMKNWNSMAPAALLPALLAALALALSLTCAAGAAERTTLATLDAAGAGTGRLFNLADEQPLASPTRREDGVYPRYSLLVTNAVMVIDGEVQSDVNQVRGTGTKIDMHRDLGFDNMWLNFDLRLEARITPRDSVFFRYGLMLAEAENVANGNLHFDHVSYRVGSKLDSKFLLRRVGLGYERGLWTKKPREFWLGLGVDDVHVRVRIIDRSNDLSDVEDITASMDLYVRARFVQELNQRVSLNVSFARSIPVDIGNIKHNTMHADFGLEWRATPRLNCYAGYALDRVDIEDREEDAPGINLYRLNGNGLIFGVRVLF